MTTKLTLTIGAGDYDHLRDVFNGVVRAGPIEVIHVKALPLQIFDRMTTGLEFDAAEMSMGRYVALRSQGDDTLRAIPVFPSRVFRLSSIYVRRRGAVKSPDDLAGKRIGLREWSQTATIYAKGWLSDHIGVPLSDIDWVQGGVDSPGRAESVELKLPANIRITPVADRSLDEMLVAGDLDAVMTSSPPASYQGGDGEIVRLIPDFRAAEERYYDDTGIFPIMHTIVLRGALVDAYPWVPKTLFDAFDEAKNNCLERIGSAAIAGTPVPWGYHDVAGARARFGDDYWPYGIEPNRPTLEAFLRFASDQGVCHRPLTPDEAFSLSGAG